MRQAIALLIVIFLALAAYTAYGLITYEPRRAAPFVFADPVLPPELLADQQAAAADDVVLTPQQQEQTTAAIAQVTQAVNLYRSYESGANAQAASTFSLLNSAILSGKLPAYLLSQSQDAAQLRRYELITLDPQSVRAAEGAQTDVNCQATDGSTKDIVIGDSRNNSLKCDAPAATVPQDFIFLGGPGDDTIVSASGNRIINAGTGDDTLTVGPGRTVIILDDAWGRDTLTVDCAGSKVEKAEIPPQFPVPWIHAYTNFIVLGPRLRMTDISWNGLVLTNKATGDTLSVSENCFNLVSAAN